MTFISRRSIATLALTALTFGLAACSDSVTDPSATNALRPAGPHLLLATTSVSTLLVDPKIDNLFISIEGHRVFIPANAICQVGTSGYGASYWNQSCTTATLPILFTITTSTDAQGYSKFTVQPDVRFSPSKTVTAFMHDSAGAQRSGGIIGYCTLLGGCIDEGKTDASMTTYRDVAQGYLYRRLKHFSGYNVIFGINCDPNVEQCESGGTSKAPMPMNLFSGYITTVGFNGHPQDDDNDDR